jgi:hypothetical protein
MTDGRRAQSAAGTSDVDDADHVKLDGALDQSKIKVNRNAIECRIWSETDISVSLRHDRPRLNSRHTPVTTKLSGS